MVSTSKAEQPHTEYGNSRCAACGPSCAGLSAANVRHRSIRWIRPLFVIGFGLFATVAWVTLSGWMLYRAIQALLAGYSP